MKYTRTKIGKTYANTPKIHVNTKTQKHRKEILLDLFSKGYTFLGRPEFYIKDERTFTHEFYNYIIINQDKTINLCDTRTHKSRVKRNPDKIFPREYDPNLPWFKEPQSYLKTTSVNYLLTNSIEDRKAKLAYLTEMGFNWHGRFHTPNQIEERWPFGRFPCLVLSTLEYYIHGKSMATTIKNLTDFPFHFREVMMEDLAGEIEDRLEDKAR